MVIAGWVLGLAMSMCAPLWVIVVTMGCSPIVGVQCATIVFGSWVPVVVLMVLISSTLSGLGSSGRWMDIALVELEASVATVIL